MIMEIMANLLDLNLGYFIDLALGGIVWIFVFMAIAFYFGDGEKVLLNFLVITGLLLSFSDLLKAHDLAYFVAPAMMMLYFLRITVLTAIEGSGYSKHMPLAYSLITYFVLFYYNFFAL